LFKKKNELNQATKSDKYSSIENQFLAAKIHKISCFSKIERFFAKSLKEIVEYSKFH